MKPPKPQHCYGCRNGPGTQCDQWDPETFNNGGALRITICRNFGFKQYDTSRKKAGGRPKAPPKRKPAGYVIAWKNRRTGQRGRGKRVYTDLHLCRETRDMLARRQTRYQFWFEAAGYEGTDEHKSEA